MERKAFTKGPSGSVHGLCIEDFHWSMSDSGTSQTAQCLFGY